MAVHLVLPMMSTASGTGWCLDVLDDLMEASPAGRQQLQWSQARKGLGFPIRRLPVVRGKNNLGGWKEI